MPNLKLKTTATALFISSAMITAPAFAQTAEDAQTAEPDVIEAVQEKQISTEDQEAWTKNAPKSEMAVEINHFALADLSADGVLDMDEYKAFISSKADAGDDDAALVRDSGDYAATFAAHDADADGTLSADEVNGTDDE